MLSTCVFRSTGALPVTPAWAIIVKDGDWSKGPSKTPLQTAQCFIPPGVRAISHLKNSWYRLHGVN